MNILDDIPSRPQRQDSTMEQLRDLIPIANKLGLYDAADAIRQLFDTDKVDQIQYGCHVDLEPHMEPDDCVLNTGEIHNCVYAKEGMRPEQCQYWKPITKRREE